MSIVPIRRHFGERHIAEYRRAASLLPVVAYDEESKIFVMDDSSVGFGFFCQPLIYGDEKIQDRVNSFLNQELPTNTLIQICLFRSPDISQQMYEMQMLRNNFRHPVMSKIINEREAFFRRHTFNDLTTRSSQGFFNLGVVQDLKLCITVKTPINGQVPTEKEMEDTKALALRLESSMQTVGLRPRSFNAQQYLHFMSTLINWSSDAPWRRDGVVWDETVPIREQVFDYDTDLELAKHNSLRLGDMYAKVLSAKRLPDAMYFGDAIKYVGDLSGGDSRLSGNYMVVTNIYIPDPEKTKSQLDRRRQFAVNQAYGPMVRFVPVLGDKKASFDLLYDSMKEGFKPIQISYSLVVFANTLDGVNKAAQRARGLWSESRFEMLEDKFIQLPIFLNCLPFGADPKAVKDLYRYKSMTTEQAAVILPIFGEWKGTGTQHASLISRNGQIMSLSLHDSTTNKNAVVAAESGSGKSFMVNELVSSYLSEGAQVWIIDVGRSYEKLCNVLDGDFIHFEESTDISLNPFELVENYGEEEDGLVSIVSTMASAKGLLTEWQESALKQIMSDLWEEKGKNMMIDDIGQRCLDSEDQRLKDVGVQLHAFTSKGSYGRYFNSKNNVSFQNQLTVLELDDLQGRQHLRQVVLLQLIYQIQQEVFLGERNRKKLVIIDEAWDLLKEGKVAVFMEHAYRKFRKYGGSVLIATQSVNDLYENPVGRAIAENSANMYLLGQTEETVESIKRSGRLALSEGGFNILRSTHTIAGVYSEIFIRSNAGVGVGRLVVSDFHKLLYSTHPDDVSAINTYIQQGLNVTDAIQQVMIDRGQIQVEKEVAHEH